MARVPREVGVGISRTGRWLTAAAASLLALGLTLPAQSEPEGTVYGMGEPTAIPDSYLVVLTDQQPRAGVSALAGQLLDRHGGAVRRTFTGIGGFSATMSEQQARELAADPGVARVEQNRTLSIQPMSAAGTQENPPAWGIDRIDQQDLPLDAKYTYPADGSGVNAYIIDTGLRTTHSTFGGRAHSGWDFVDNDADASDGHGHGTHVAGTIGGAEYGVAKNVTLWGVRVLDDKGSGSTEQVVAGIDWVTKNAQKPAVANMSLGGTADPLLDDAVRRSIAAGITYAIAAGNGNAFGQQQNACAGSPSRVAEAITVSATDKTDKKAKWANYGTCVDIFAPGVDITSSWGTSDTGTKTISGTSMATPHVAGAAAIYLGQHPGATPQQARDGLVNAASSGKVTSPGTGTPNKLLYVG
ncbi:S8 family peptidase [Pseudonocardiaceae bacterium YIM PH 21723]|nr:S8 family peptidase [Pseudonocardiaceae bacterium YIM PH 21723]